MLQGLKLLLPALLPSWRFFDIIAPSPRIEYRLFDRVQKPLGDWQEFRPRPQSLSLATMIKRMIWNPRWNETLYLVSCAERIMAGQVEHSSQQIRQGIESELVPERGFDSLQFRLVFVHREAEAITKDVCFVSPVYPRKEGDS